MPSSGRQPLPADIFWKIQTRHKEPIRPAAFAAMLTRSADACVHMAKLSDGGYIVRPRLATLRRGSIIFGLILEVCNTFAREQPFAASVVSGLVASGVIEAMKILRDSVRSGPVGELVDAPTSLARAALSKPDFALSLSDVFEAAASDPAVTAIGTGRTARGTQVMFPKEYFADARTGLLLPMGTLRRFELVETFHIQIVEQVQTASSTVWRLRWRQQEAWHEGWVDAERAPSGEWPRRLDVLVADLRVRGHFAGANKVLDEVELVRVRWNAKDDGLGEHGKS
jgi:hypothetical protein